VHSIDELSAQCSFWWAANRLTPEFGDSPATMVAVTAIDHPSGSILP
jgi:hypothetical protein